MGQSPLLQRLSEALFNLLTQLFHVPLSKDNVDAKHHVSFGRVGIRAIHKVKFDVLIPERIYQREISDGTEKSVNVMHNHPRVFLRFQVFQHLQELRPPSRDLCAVRFADDGGDSEFLFLGVTPANLFLCGQ
ncbi:MAG: hypothetical protein PHE68_02955 [Candidatus Peribacteraceae bacterium]|nr:hypothetical protein [Candidatus Peribacteraceae bacterium]MDD5074808.1 hypothetical protein [Candidatus Peribacteraceae bacterium]